MAGILRYPYEALTDHTDYLQINLVEKKTKEFTAKSFLSELDLINRGKFNNSDSNKVPEGLQKNQLVDNIRKTVGIIILPIPSSINDTNQVNYSDDNLDAITATLAGKIGDLTGTTLFNTEGGLDLTSFNQKLASIFNTDLAKNLPLIKNLILTNLAGQAAGLAGLGNLSLNQALARSSGQIINPNVELLFNGPTIRNFRFSFKMTPRNKEEANQIKLIIRTLKKHMSPRDNASGDNVFLKAPNTFELRYKNGASDHQYLNRFKQCALENMSVNYTGENVYATYEDGAPISTVMDLTFKELEPIYESDYGNGEGQIGTGY